MTKLDFDNLNAPCPACGKGEQRKTPNPNVGNRLRNPGPKPQYVRIHNRHPDKDPRFLNQVPTVHLEAVTWNQDRKSFPPSAAKKNIQILGLTGSGFRAAGGSNNDMGVSENRGTLFWGPYNKDPAI